MNGVRAADAAQLCAAPGLDLERQRRLRPGGRRRIWLRTATSTCRTSAATGNPASPCATAGDEVLTSYDYGPDSGPNTLLLRGQAVTATDGGVATTLRTCYAYDALGRKISETQPNANLDELPGDAADHGARPTPPPPATTPAAG